MKIKKRILEGALREASVNYVALGESKKAPKSCYKIMLHTLGSKHFLAND